MECNYQRPEGTPHNYDNHAVVGFMVNYCSEKELVCVTLHSYIYSFNIAFNLMIVRARQLYTVNQSQHNMSFVGHDTKTRMPVWYARILFSK